MESKSIYDLIELPENSSKISYPISSSNQKAILSCIKEKLIAGNSVANEEKLFMSISLEDIPSIKEKRVFKSEMKKIYDMPVDFDLGHGRMSLFLFSTVSFSKNGDSVNFTLNPNSNRIILRLAELFAA